MVDDIGIPLDFGDDPTPPIEEPPEGLRTCAFDGCQQTFTVNPRGFGSKRLYCDTHRSGGSTGKKKRSDRKPASVTVNVGPRAASKSKDLDAVKENAEALVRMMAMAAVMMGQEADAGDLLKGAEPWASSVRDLAAHEDVIRKMFTGGETSQRALAWLGFAIATGSLALPILSRHGVLGPKMQAQVAQLFGDATGFPEGPVTVGEPIVVEPTAA